MAACLPSWVAGLAVALCAHVVVVGATSSQYWNSSVENSIFFYDEETDGLYLYPNTLTGMLGTENNGDIWNTGIMCTYGAMASPGDAIFHPLARPSGWIYKVAAADVKPDGMVPWDDGFYTQNAPPEWLYAQSAVFIPERRILVVVGGVFLTNVSHPNADPTLCMWSSLNSSWMAEGGQCAYTTNRTHILHLSNWTWTTLEQSDVGFPIENVPEATPSRFVTLFSIFVTVVYDPVEDRLLAIGGAADTITPCIPKNTYQTYQFSFQTWQWSVIPTSRTICVGLDTAIDFAVIQYDCIRKQLVVYSGTETFEAYSTRNCLFLDMTTGNWTVEEGELLQYLARRT